MFQEILNNLTGLIYGIRIRDIIDILIVAFAVYKIMQFISKTRAVQIVKGLIVLLVAMVLSDLLGLYTVHFLLYNGLVYGLMAIIVIFYPELRQALEYLGRGTFIPHSFTKHEKDDVKGMIIELCKAISYFSETQTGALIIIERDIDLGNIVDNGTKVDADVTALLLETIFYEGSALHDGAVIIREDRVHTAGCVLPLSRDNSLEQTLGTRHRAGLGVSEVSDAFVIIVSEETGIISVAKDGKLSRFLDVKTIEKSLYNIYLSSPEELTPSKSIINFLRGGGDDR